MSSGTAVWRLAKLANDNGVAQREIAEILEVGPALVNQKITEVRSNAE